MQVIEVSPDHPIKFSPRIPMTISINYDWIIEELEKRLPDNPQWYDVKKGLLDMKEEQKRICNG